MTREYIAYLSSTHFSGGEEVLRVTAKGEFIWNERADELIASGDYTQYPALRYVLMALRENERLREAVKAEREACAKVAENTYDRQIVWYPKGHYIDPNSLGDINKAVAEGCAAAIRARGERCANPE